MVRKVSARPTAAELISSEVSPAVVLWCKGACSPWRLCDRSTMSYRRESPSGRRIQRYVDAIYKVYCVKISVSVGLIKILHSDIAHYSGVNP